jgi:plastocyanin
MTEHKKWLPGVLMFVGATYALAQAQSEHPRPKEEQPPKEHAASVVQIVALDECDPATFNAALGPDFCKNVALAPLGFATTFQDLFTKAAAGTPDPGWDFEPDKLNVKAGTTLLVTDQGGEPHTFTEVKNFGGGFVPGLNAGEEPVSECAGGFKNVEVAKTRILQGSSVAVTDLSKGEHRFQCCIHPWMRMTVEVK